MDGEPIHEGRVLKDWIDVNNHMNVAYYVLAFDHGIDALWRRFGMDEDYIRRRKLSTFAVEAHIEYLRELDRDAPFVVTTQVLAFDSKRIHQYQRMYHRDEGFLAATCEWMNLHVDLEVRRVAPWPDEVLQQLGEFAEAQNSLELPERAGRRIRVKQPVFAVYPGDDS